MSEQAIDKLKTAYNLIQEAANDQSCSLCKESLDLIAKGLKAEMIKLTDLGNMVNKLEKEGLLNVDDAIKEKYDSNSDSRPKADSLGVSDLYTDIADILDDVKEVNNLVSVIDELNPIRNGILQAVLPNPLDPLGLFTRRNK
jgi:uncharacterized protein Yka (UPF0111/DUF47 family)